MLVQYTYSNGLVIQTFAFCSGTCVQQDSHEQSKATAVYTGLQYMSYCIFIYGHVVLILLFYIKEEE